MDGTGVPMRAPELQGRAGKQPDGSGSQALHGVERRETGRGGPAPARSGLVNTAAIESAASLDTDRQLSDFAQRVEREAQRRRFEEAPRQVVLGDAAKWIWNLAGELFPEAGRSSIVSTPRSDCMSCPRVCMEIATGASDGPNNVAGNSMRVRFDPFGPRPEEGAPRRGSSRLPPPRMRYAQFEALGLCTSTGVVEAGQKRHRGSTDPGCIGVCGEPIPSWPFVALDSVDALRIFGNGGPITGRSMTQSSLFCRAPQAAAITLIYCWNRRQGALRAQSAIRAESGIFSRHWSTQREPFFLTDPSGSIWGDREAV